MGTHGEGVHKGGEGVWEEWGTIKEERNMSQLVKTKNYRGANVVKMSSQRAGKERRRERGEREKDLTDSKAKLVDFAGSIRSRNLSILCYVSVIYS